MHFTQLLLGVAYLLLTDFRPQAKAYFFRRGFGVSRTASDDPEADLSVHFGPFPEAQERFVYASSTLVRP